MLQNLLLGEISEYIEQVWLPADCFVLVKLSPRRIRLLQLEITIDSILQSICAAKLPVQIKRNQVSYISSLPTLYHYDMRASYAVIYVLLSRKRDEVSRPNPDPC